MIWGKWKDRSFISRVLQVESLLKLAGSFLITFEKMAFLKEKSSCPKIFVERKKRWVDRVRGWPPENFISKSRQKLEILFFAQLCIRKLPTQREHVKVSFSEVMRLQSHENDDFGRVLKVQMLITLHRRNFGFQENDMKRINFHWPITGHWPTITHWVSHLWKEYVSGHKSTS